MITLKKHKANDIDRKTNKLRANIWYDHLHKYVQHQVFSSLWTNVEHPFSRLIKEQYKSSYDKIKDT